MAEQQTQARIPWAKAALVVVVFGGLLALDAARALQGVPLLLVGIGLALLVTDRLRRWLQAHERAGLATLPFMAAALVLLLAFCKGRDLSQGVLLLITIALVFDILLLALALIAETSKRGARGIIEFFGLAGSGIVIGFVLSLVFFLDVGLLGGTGLAQP